MNKIKYIFTFLSLVFVINTTLGQELKLTGTLINQTDNDILIGATMKLTQKRDTTKFKYTTSGTKGEFSFQQLTRGRYKLEITYVGFENFTQEFMVNENTNNIGVLRLKPAAQNLGSVEITGIAARAEQKGDTTQYNAGAFKVTQDATTEDLVKKMPGITIENGTIKAHGEDVKKILVDGKQFFGDDPSVTLKNLPAEVVDKIQVFDRLSDQAAWTGFDDGSGQKTINIITRNAKNVGQFGKFSAGYGTDDRYLLGANINFFNGQRRISLLGMSNNVNQQNFSADDVMGSGSGGRQQGMPGGGRSGGSFGGSQMGPQSGIFSTHAIGGNYTQSWGTKLVVNGSYFLNLGKSSTDRQVNRQYIMGGETNQYYNEISTSGTDNTNHRMNMRIEYNPDSTNSFMLSPRFNYQVNTSNSYLGAITYSDKELTPANMLNKSTNNNNGGTDGYNFNNEFLYRHKFNKKGRTFSVNLTSGLSNRYRDNYTFSISDYYVQKFGNKNDSIQQYGKSLTTGINLSSNVVYTEPLGKNSQLQLSYNVAWSQNDNDKKTYNYVNRYQDYTSLDTLLTNQYDNGYLTHRIGGGYLYQTEEVNLNVGLNYQYAALKGNTSFPYMDSTSKSFSTVLPNIMLNYKFSKLTNLRFSYRASTNAPSIGQLQKVVDNSNPLLLSTGNPGLKEETRHFVMSRFSHSNAAKTMNLFTMLFAQKTQNYIGNSTLLASRDTVIFGKPINKGTRLTIPENLKGSWNGRLLVTIGFPIKPIKSNLNFNTGVSYNKLPSMINAKENFSNTYGLNVGTVLSSNISEKLDFTLTYNINYNLVENSIQPELNNNYFFQIGSAQLNWEFWKGFFIQNSITYQNYNGISAKITDQYTLWNFNLGKRIFKKKTGEIKLSCYDLLDQNKSLSRNVTDTYIEDSNTQVLSKYFILSFTYNLRNFNGKIPTEERRGFEGGRPDYHAH